MADLVEVVRCKDCVHSKYPGEKVVWCKRNSKYVPMKGYCNYGERKDEDGE